MAICTGQYVCLLLSASLYVLSMYVDIGAFFGPKAGRTFLLAATLHCFRLENSTFSTSSKRVKNNMEANVLVVLAPSS